MSLEKIIVLDFGGQYAHLIANRIRRLGVFSEICTPDTDLEKLREAKGIIFSGGPSSVYEENAPTVNKGIYDLGIPILGLCYGHQLIAHQLNGRVARGRTREYGISELKIVGKPELFSDIEDREDVWMSHGDTVTSVPMGFDVIGKTKDCNIAAMSNDMKRIYGLQFHPEVTHTPCGGEILHNFLSICGCRKDWSMKNYIADMKTKIVNDTKDKNVLAFISGGVDSSVMAVLLNSLIPDKTSFVFIDNGLVRENEIRNIKEFAKKNNINLRIYDASEMFLGALKGIHEPEEKRKIIGEMFVEAREKIAREWNLNLENLLLAQGTIYPDTIESGSTKFADIIKTHHNRVEGIRDLIGKGLVLEPLKDLYKDEVRVLGKELGIDESIIYRHPFPGPGLGVRLICSSKDCLPKNIAEVKTKLKEVLDGSGYLFHILPIKSVGVQGDSRSYKNPVVIYGKFDSWDNLEELSTRITNSVPEINRVIYSLSHGEPSGYVHVSSTITKNRLDLLRQADRIVNDFVEKKGYYNLIWQMPIVMVPLVYNFKKGESIVLRPINSREAMTANFSKDFKIDDLKKLTKKLLNEGYSAVFYDITNKPPATIEWE